MNNIFKKLAVFLGAAILSVGLFQGQVRAADDDLTTAVKAFADPYTASGSQPFNLQSFFSTHDLYSFSSTHDMTPTPQSMVVYDLGQSPRAFPINPFNINIVGDPTPADVSITSLVDCDLNPNGLVWNLKISGDDWENGFPGIYEKATTGLSGPSEVVEFTGKTRAKLWVHAFVSQPGKEEIVVEGSKEERVDVQSTFYDLSSEAGLADYWLGVSPLALWKEQTQADLNYDAVSDTYSIPTDSIISAYLNTGTELLQLIKDEDENYPVAYSVYLFGPTPGAEPPPTVPEPQVYLLLGTLLGCVGLVAYRRRQQA